MSSSSEPRCVICGKQAHASCGLVIRGKNICDECEREIVYTTVVDRKYDFYKNKLKEILCGIEMGETTL